MLFEVLKPQDAIKKSDCFVFKVARIFQMDFLEVTLHVPAPREPPATRLTLVVPNLQMNTLPVILQ